MTDLAVGVVPPATASEAELAGNPKWDNRHKLPLGVSEEDRRACGNRLPPLPFVLNHKGKRVRLEWESSYTCSVAVPFWVMLC